MSSFFNKEEPMLIITWCRLVPNILTPSGQHMVEMKMNMITIERDSFDTRMDTAD
jgi:hypothetical protein